MGRAGLGFDPSFAKQQIRTPQVVGIADDDGLLPILGAHDLTDEEGTFLGAVPLVFQHDGLWGHSLVHGKPGGDLGLSGRMSPQTTATDNGSGQATPPAGAFSQVSTRYGHSCGVKTDGTIACWGEPDFLNFGQATPPAGAFSQVSAGNRHTCGVKTDGTVACWGLHAR